MYGIAAVAVGKSGAIGTNEVDAGIVQQIRAEKVWVQSTLMKVGAAWPELRLSAGTGSRADGGIVGADARSRRRGPLSRR